MIRVEIELSVPLPTEVPGITGLIGEALGTLSDGYNVRVHRVTVEEADA